jgi:hypothetical protein
MCDCFSLQFGESTDISDTAQLSVMVRTVFSDFIVEEELLKVLSVRRQTEVEDSCNTFRTYAMEIRMPQHRLCAVTTDGAPAVMASISGFIALCKKDESFLNFVLSTRKLWLLKYFHLSMS